MSDHLAAIPLPRGRFIPESALTMRASTSGGPGGQHANRSSTRIELSVLISELPLTDYELTRLRSKLATKISADDTITVGADDQRSQLQNRIAARERLGNLIADALKVDPPRVKTKPSRAARLRARLAKEQRSARKKNRKSPGWDD
jgi:ribosome-associated protein